MIQGSDKTMSDKTFSKKALMWSVVIGLLFCLSGWVMYVFWRPLGGEKVIIPRAQLKSEAAPKAADTPAEPEGRARGCAVPALPEGVGSKDIRALPGAALSFLGGTIEKGKYRVVDTFALTQEFTPGRWTFTLDLSDNQQGAYYRPAGLSFRSSRISWAIHGNRLSWQTLCPDPGESMSFEFTVVGARLYLLTREKIVVVLEPYADSEVTRLAPVGDP